MSHAVDKCIYCGRSEEEHCTFAPAKVPPGCGCDPRTWGNPAAIPPACGAYVGDAEAYCTTCEHEQACHRKVSP